MCRSIHTLYNVEPAVERGRGARRRAPVRAQDQRLPQAVAGERGRVRAAVDAIAAIAVRLLGELETSAAAPLETLRRQPRPGREHARV